VKLSAHTIFINPNFVFFVINAQKMITNKWSHENTTKSFSFLRGGLFKYLRSKAVTVKRAANIVISSPSQVHPTGLLQSHDDVKARFICFPTKIFQLFGRYSIRIRNSIYVISSRSACISIVGDVFGSRWRKRWNPYLSYILTIIQACLCGRGGER